MYTISAYKVLLNNTKKVMASDKAKLSEWRSKEVRKHLSTQCDQSITDIRRVLDAKNPCVHKP